MTKSLALGKKKVSQRSKNVSSLKTKKQVGKLSNSSRQINKNVKSPRRNFLEFLTLGGVAVGTTALVWPFIDSMNPAKDVLSLASIEVSLDGIEVGQSITVSWRGKPVFIKRRTKKEIDLAKLTKLDQLIDPQLDEERVVSSEWLIVVGICTHLGCVPIGQGESDFRGDYGGWFCPCHGSHYDTSGRIRKGPAPKNLVVPSYSFKNEKLVKIG